MPVSSIKILSTITHPPTDQYATVADTTLTLACQGTTTVTTMEGAKPEPVSMGLIVNFTNNTVHGFGHPGWSDPPVKITVVTEVLVAFGGSESSLGSKGSISGSADRITGDVEATYMLTTDRENKWENKVLFSKNYAEMQASATDVLRDDESGAHCDDGVREDVHPQRIHATRSPL